MQNAEFLIKIWLLFYFNDLKNKIDFQIYECKKRREGGFHWYYQELRRKKNHEFIGAERR